MTTEASALRHAQQVIASAMCGEGRPEKIGALVLRPHQEVAVARLRSIIATWRGALLADAVGLGKTYVALAIAREHERVLILCPAALRQMWEQATTAAGASFPIVSIEALSRGLRPEFSPSLIIIDEAHHLRTPGTRRYEAVERLACSAHVLLLSATPLHNSRSDLTALLALFAGSAVRTWSAEALARLIVRRDESSSAEVLPAIAGPDLLGPVRDDDCLEAILTLPHAVPAADEGTAHALTTISLLHLWASSRAALITSVRRRLARAIALRDAVARGHLPTAADLAAWELSDDTLQLAFPFHPVGGVRIVAEDLLSKLDAFAEGATHLLHRCGGLPDPDVTRVRLLRELRERHAGQRIVAFSQYAQTVRAFGRLMREDDGVAIITANASRISSGTIKRQEVLRQFCVPSPDVHPSERIDILLATDLLSEGIDLRGAPVVVHLDLPWNPARMEQRVGRSRRMGSPYETIRTYAFAPPAAAERILELRRRLAGKIQAVRTLVGGNFDPLGDGVAAAGSPVAANEALRARLVAWDVGGLTTRQKAPAVAAATSSFDGWFAVVLVGGLPRFIFDVGQGIREDATEALRVVDSVGSARHVDPLRLHRAMNGARVWIAAREAGAMTETVSAAKRAMLDRLSETAARAPRHRRSTVLATVGRLRGGLSRVRGVGAEKEMAALARSTDNDDAWLQAVASFADHAAPQETATSDRNAVVAVILLDSVSPAADAIPG